MEIKRKALNASAGRQFSYYSEEHGKTVYTNRNLDGFIVGPEVMVNKYQLEISAYKIRFIVDFDGQLTIEVSESKSAIKSNISVYPETFKIDYTQQ